MDKRLLDLFLEITKIESTSGNERPIAEYILEFLKKLKLEPFEDNSKQMTGSNTGNIICKIGNGGSSILTAHMDTVKPTSKLKHIITQDKITSDGTTILGADNRAGVTVILYAVEKLLLENDKLNNFTIGFTTCEETTLNGSRYIEISPEIKNGYVFDSSFRPGNVVCQTPGELCFTINIFGRAAHSGISPEKGISSIQIAANAISKLIFGRVDSDTTANIGIIKGGSAVNIIPELTILEGEVRSTAPEKAEMIFNKICSTFESEANMLNGKVEIKHGWDFRPYKITQDHEIYKIIFNVISKTGLEPAPVLSFGGSDANSFNERGISSVDIGIGAQNPHANDEFILIDDLKNSAAIALELMKQLQ
jgi:tripeptide aminopeptidase